jgi:hypothetical protein
MLDQGLNNCACLQYTKHTPGGDEHTAHCLVNKHQDTYATHRAVLVVLSTSGIESTTKTPT